MKKLLLLFLLSTGITATNASAQSYTVAHDTARAVVSSGGTAYIYNDITNISSNSIQLNWKVIDHNLPTSWISSSGICDNVTCYSTDIFNDNTYKTTDNIDPNKSCDFHIQVDGNSLPSGGPYYVTIESKDAAGPSTKQFTFELLKFPTNVNSISKSDDVTVYPNPAHNEINVIFNPNAGIKNIAIYNLIGKPVIVYKVSGNSAKLNIESIPSGIYFLRMADAQGRIITRKFTHQ